MMDVFFSLEFSLQSLIPTLVHTPEIQWEWCVTGITVLAMEVDMWPMKGNQSQA
jgi:hypothetical protein